MKTIRDTIKRLIRRPRRGATRSGRIRIPVRRATRRGTPAVQTVPVRVRRPVSKADMLRAASA